MKLFSASLSKTFRFQAPPDSIPHRRRAFASGLAVLVAAGLIFAGAGSARSEDKPAGGSTPSPAGATEYFVDLKDGATIEPTTTIHFGLHGMGLAPAGVEKDNSGHHHLLIDTALPPLDEPIPSDANHLHFGAGQTEADVTLTPGPHTLQLLLGDYSHVPHSPPVMSKVIHVTVVDPKKAKVADKSPGGTTPSPPGATEYFVDLKDGATIEPTTTIHFGLHGMGLAPAGVEKDNSGHHHLLIDTELPPLDEPIPSDANHLHFGAGQTEADVTLTPGPHTLQLLLGDYSHVPHSPPVMSKVIHVTVVDPKKASVAEAPSETSQRHSSPPGAKVYFEYPSDGAYVSPTPTIKFGLVNMAVAPAGVERANTGHHHIIIDAPLPPLDEPIPNDPNHLHFGTGETEAKISLTPGPHTLQLLLGDENHMPHDPPVYSKPIKIFVTATGRRPEAHRHHRHNGYYSYR